MPLGRLFLLTIVTTALALALEALLAATEAPAAGVLILIVIPAAAAAVIFFGLRPYPLAGRARLAAMVAAALFLAGMAL
jgi:hypothetical protein